MKRTGFTITFENGESHTRYLAPIGMRDGVWLDKEGNKLQQSNNLTEKAFFGENVKIQIETFNITDGEKLDVKIKAKIGEDYIEEFEEVIHKLEVKNNLATLDNFYLDSKWYNEEIESYNYDTHSTEIDFEKAITFVFEAKFEDKDWDKARVFPKNENNYLRPITYRRNYEELIGLFNTNNGGEKDLENNYENKFINGNSDIKSIVDEFIEKVIAEDIKVPKIKTVVEEKATVLWNAAVKQVQKGNLDDRPLYWARNKMQTWLKRNPIFKDQIDFDKSIVKKGTKLDDIITLFEEKSRNYTGVDFSKAGNKKKMLITGFDPFVLNQIKYSWADVNTQNPSGISALYFHNKTIGNTFFKPLLCLLDMKILTIRLLKILQNLI